MIYLPAAAGFTLIVVKVDGSLNVRGGAVIGWQVDETDARLPVTPIYQARGNTFQPLPTAMTPSLNLPGSFVGLQLPDGTIEAVAINSSVTPTMLAAGFGPLPRSYQSRDAMFQEVARIRAALLPVT